MGIAGVLRPQAYVRRLLDAAALELPGSPALSRVTGLPGRSEPPEAGPPRFEVWEGLDRIPSARTGPIPAEADEFCRVLSAADGMVITVPGYNLLPEQLGHALDWAASPLAGGALVGKPVAVITSCVSPHEAIWAQTELHRLLGAGGAVVYGVDLTVLPGTRQFNVIGRLADPVARDRIRTALRAVCATAREDLAAKAALHTAGLPSPGNPAPGLVANPVPSPLSGEVPGLPHPQPAHAVRREPDVLPKRGHRRLRSDELLDPVDVAAGDLLG
ncbi:hypothetical protein Plo01_42470 [Planobispora longispora]|uniref:NADPH-dependent FMN reductase-like domain-containing protein n=1 Tax=Planobispora longispora TaxID=28887 RepID=A0A8J3RT70_9ACTN|nr:hypothetical protein Plo01_42470 [Planobispora longispora]